MVVEEVVNVSSEFVSTIGKIALWLQALGIVIVFYIVAQTITLIMNRKQRKLIYHIEEKLDILDKKINKLLKK